MNEKSEKKEKLTPEQYQICRLKGTEAPFSGEYVNNKEAGVYHCVCCDAALFSSDDKFDSGTGWPSYMRPYQESAIKEQVDSTHGLKRVEVLCGHCDAHLGHVFPDGPKPTGLRYCINSGALRFVSNKKIDR